MAEAVLAVVRDRRGEFADEEAVWEAFIAWRGRGEGEYLRRIRAGRKFIFHAVLHDLYNFAEEACGENVADAVGRQLAGTLLERHMADLLQTMLGQGEALAKQIVWLVDQFVAGACGDVYCLSVDPSSDDTHLGVAVAYRSEAEMVDYLRRSGHEPERAFADSFHVIKGALLELLGRVVCDFSPQQLQSELRPLHGRFRLTLADANRFHHENIIDILLRYVRRLRERTRLEAPLPLADADLHVSEAMKAAWGRVRKAAAADETVLLCGESGTGKSYYARVIHDISARHDGPFVEVGLTSDVGSDNLIQSNLFGHVRGAFTGADDEKQGLFTLADGGTIFLDEIGDASPELQARLLRVIDTKTFKMLGGVCDTSVDVRIIAATNRTLADLVRTGRFRQDLYYRLNVIQILLPPLRQRPEDVPALVQKLFDKVRRDAGREEMRLSDPMRNCLCAYPWPGNIRELENALRRAVALSEAGEVTLEDLPDAVRAAASARAQTGTQQVVDTAALRRAFSGSPQAAGARPFEWPGHVDYARRAYMKALIQHYGGDLKRIARHWDRSSENTLLKVIRGFGLADELRAARRRDK